MLLSGCRFIKGNVTEKEPTAAELFKAESESFKKSDYVMEIEATSSKAVGTYSFKEELKQSFEATSTGTYYMSGRLIADNNIRNIKEGYWDGYAYLEIDGTVYRDETTSEEYLKDKYPLVPIDADKYTTVVAEEKVYTFENAVACEEWLADKDAEIISAKAVADFSVEGQLKITYDVEYVNGPLMDKAQYVFTVKDGDGVIEKLQSEKIFTVTDMRIPRMLDYAKAIASEMPALSGNLSENIRCDAAGATLVSNEEYLSYGAGESLHAKVDATVQVTTSQGGYEVEWYEIFKDGVATLYENGKSSVDQGVTNKEMNEYMWNSLAEFCPDMSDAANMTLTENFDHYLIEVELTRAASYEIEDYISYQMFGDANFLQDNFGGSFSADKVECHVVLDGDTGFITGVYLHLTGKHTVQGENYTVEFLTENTIEVGDPDAYYELTGEHYFDVSEKQITPALYEISGERGKMYLFGTIHVGDASSKNLPTALVEALKSADALALETNMDNFEERLKNDSELLKAYYEGRVVQYGTAFYHKLSETEHAELNLATKIYGVYSTYENIQPAALASMLSNIALDRSNSLYSDKGAEERLTKIAKDNGVSIIEVEDVYESVRFFSKFSSELHITTLIMGLEELYRSENASLKETYDVWAQGDEEKLKEYLKIVIPEDATDEEKAVLEEYKKLMLTDRDAKMVLKAKEYINSGKTVFMAVGAAHVLGETGILDALAKEGYTVKKVEY